MKINRSRRFWTITRSKTPHPASIYSFSAVEVLVVVGIIGVMVAVLLPVLSRSRQKAKYTKWVMYKNNIISGADSGSGDSGLIAYYTFEEGEGDVLHNRAPGSTGSVTRVDDDPEKLDGTIYGAAWVKDGGRWAGKFALSFDGQSSYVRVPDSVRFNIGDTVSLEVWMKTPLTASYKGIVGTNNVYGDAGEKVVWFMDTTTSGGVRAGFMDSAGASPQLPVTTPYAIDEKWHQIVGVLNGTEATLYVDGCQVSYQTFSNNGDFNARRDIMIGCVDTGTPEYFFSGMIDEVAIYGRALTAKEIENHYEMGKP